MRLKKWIVPFLIIGPITVTLICALLKRRGVKTSKYAVTVTATSGGTVDSSYPPDTYAFAEPTQITVSASPKAGYVFNGWWLDGEYQHNNLTFTFTVSENHLLVASFEVEDGPQLFPAYIKPAQNCVSEDWWYTFTTATGMGGMLYLTREFYKSGFAQFKICDAAGNGVPGQQIAVYTDSQPDITDFGTLMLKDAVHTVDNPLILVSDSRGIVYVKAKYSWEELGSDFVDTIGYGGKVHWNCLVYGGDTYPIANGITVIYPCYFESFTRMRNPVIGPTLNAIHAYWVDNPGLPVSGDCYATCMVKIEASKNY